MFKLAKPFFLIVGTPLHAGSGSDLGIVDLPIQRERYTDCPKIEASGLKGSLREIFEAQKENLPPELIEEFPLLTRDNYKKKGIFPTFGPDNGDLHAGALGFTDARLLLFPVKSVKSVFAWITCPLALERFRNDLKLAKEEPSVLNNLDNIEGTVPSESGLIIRDNRIVLEEYTFEISLSDNCTQVCQWLAGNVLPDGPEYDYWRNKMSKDVVVLSDNDFRDFVTLSTEVVARTKIDEKTGTVDKNIGGLWYEEYLPSDSVMYSLVLTTPIFNENTDIFPDEKHVMTFFEKVLPSVIQIGGNATLGKGLVHTKVLSNSNNGGQNNDN